MDMDDLRSRRVSERLSATLDEIQEQIIEERELEDAEAGGTEPEAWPYDATRKYIDSLGTKVTELIDGKSGWITGSTATLRGSWTTEPGNPPPSWFLDWQQELAEIVLSRRWIRQLEKLVGRLIEVETLVLTDRAPIECKASLEEAGICYLYGFLRASAILTRTAIEVALGDCFRRHGCSDQ